MALVAGVGQAETSSQESHLGLVVLGPFLDAFLNTFAEDWIKSGAARNEQAIWDADLAVRSSAYYLLMCFLRFILWDMVGKTTAYGGCWFKFWMVHLLLKSLIMPWED